MNAIEITADNFEKEVRNSKLPVFALLYATPWCWPCKALAPIAADIAEEFARSAIHKTIKSPPREGFARA